jgi:hypothetical protein
MLAGRAGAYSSGCTLWVGTWPYPKTLDSAGNACQGQTSLLGIFVSNDRKKFYNIGPGLTPQIFDQAWKACQRQNALAYLVSFASDETLFSLLLKLLQFLFLASKARSLPLDCIPRFPRASMA